MNKLISLIILSSVLVSGCETEQVFITTSTVDLQKEDKNNTMPYPGKPTAAVDMTYSMNKNIQAGESINIDIMFINKNNVDDLIINFKLDAGLSSNDTLQQNFGVLSAGETSSIKFAVMAASDGRYYINITATLVSDTQQGRSFVIPVNVGNVDVKQSMKTNGNVETDDSGRKIISMPAEMVHE